MLLNATVGRFTRSLTGGLSRQPLRLTNFQSLAVAETEPRLVEAARAGRRFFGGCNIIANGIAPVAAIPTTTGTLALYNSDPAKYLCIDFLAFMLGSGTAAAGATLYGTVAALPIASAPTAQAAGYGVQSASGSTRQSAAIWATAITVPASNSWAILSSSLQLAAVQVGAGVGYGIDLAGGLIIPPLRALALGILSGTGTSPLYSVSAFWSEFELDAE